MGKYDCLKLSNQICFPLYVCSKEINKRYAPLLKDLDLTYTQYITMMVMWEKETIDMRTLEKMLYLDSGTLTPVLKKLESKEYITKTRSKEDNRNMIISITQNGLELKNTALKVPKKIGCNICLDENEALQLYTLLYKIISNFNE